MNQRGEFPLLSNSLHMTISAMKNEDSNFAELVQVVLSDFSLTQKVMRLANSAMYISFGRNVTTVTRALMILGVEVVGHLVIGVKLIDHFRQASSKAERIDAKLELNRVMLASYIARKVTDSHDIHGSEQAVVCTLMCQLGRLLCLFYLEQEWQAIHESTARGQGQDQACEAVLGISFEDLGLEAAQRWGLPGLIYSGMQRFDPAHQDLSLPAEVQWLQAVTSFSTDVSTLLTEIPADTQLANEQLAQVAAHYSEVLKIEPGVLLEIPRSLAQDSGSTQHMKEIDNLRAQTAQVKIQDTRRHLRECLNDLRALPSEKHGAQALTMALETMLSSLSFSRALVFLHDRKAGVFAARFGLGANIAALLPSLQFGQDFSPDVFHLALANSMGIFIEDSNAPNFSLHIPDWFKTALPDAQGFILLPVRCGNSAVALLYGDWNKPGLMRKILPQEMSVLNELAKELGRFF